MVGWQFELVSGVVEAEIVEPLRAHGGGPLAPRRQACRINMGLLNLGSAVGTMKSGRVKSFALTSASRHPDFPNLPTTSESGVPGFAEGIWIGLVAPAAVPRPIIDRLGAEVVKVLQTQDVRARLGQLGVHAIGTTPEEAAARIKREVPRYSAVIRSANIKPD